MAPGVHGWYPAESAANLSASPTPIRFRSRLSGNPERSGMRHEEVLFFARSKKADAGFMTGSRRGGVTAPGEMQRGRARAIRQARAV